MTDRELRLRQRIDNLMDENETLRAERDLWQDRAEALQEVLIARTSVARNQHGEWPVYPTERARREARRLSWRKTKLKQRALDGALRQTRESAA